MCTTTNGVWEICAAARRRIAALHAPVQLSLFRHEPVVRATPREPEPEPDPWRQLQLPAEETLIPDEAR